MKSNWNLLLLPAIMWLSACRISKDIHTPQPELPAAFRNSTAADSNIAAQPWNRFFTDPLLQALIDSAIARNYDMLVAEQNIEASRLMMRQSKWGYAPDVLLRLGASTTRPSDNSLNGISLSQFLGTTHIEDYTAAANLSWEADIWGKVRNQKRGAKAAYLQSQEARKALQTALVAAVARGYYNLLVLDSQLHIAAKNLALADSTLQIIKLQYNAGQVTLLGVQQAEAQQLAAAQLVPQFTEQIQVQENALSVLTGTLPGTVQRSRVQQAPLLPATVAAGVPSELLRLRPDVHSSELALTIANAQVGITKANLYPTLSITASGGVNAFKFSNWFSMPASLFGMAAGGLVEPVLQQRRLRTQYKLAEVEREKTVLRFRQTVLQAVGEVSDALASVTQLGSSYEIAAKRAHTLQTAIGNADMLFQNGMATYLEVITAQANLLQSELELSNIRRAQYNASIELYRSLGGGWK